MRSAARTLLVSANFVLLASLPLLQRAVGGDTRPFAVLTLLIGALNTALVALWRTDGGIRDSGFGRTRSKAGSRPRSL